MTLINADRAQIGQRKSAERILPNKSAVSAGKNFLNPQTPMFFPQQLS
jgi:hypothetical protein